MHAKCFARLQLNKVITNRLNCHKKQYELKLLSSTKSSTHTVHSHSHTYTHTCIHTYVLVYCHLMWNYWMCLSNHHQHWLRLCHEQYHEQISKWSNTHTHSRTHTLTQTHTQTHSQLVEPCSLTDRAGNAARSAIFALCWQCRPLWQLYRALTHWHWHWHTHTETSIYIGVGAHWAKHTKNGTKTNHKIYKKNKEQYNKTETETSPEIEKIKRKRREYSIDMWTLAKTCIWRQKQWE